MSNANTIALNGSILVVVACAEAIVVITRNYDISVGAIVALSSYVGLASITLLSIFLRAARFFRRIVGRGVERPIVAAKH